MIERYSRSEMRKIWTDENKFQTYLKIEKLSAQAFEQLGVIPKKDLDLIEKNATFRLERIYELEQETKHDVVAFTRAVSESLGDEKKWIHFGLTSTDVVDTANGYLLKQANEILERDFSDLMSVLKNQALRFKNTPCIGRTHGIHADITSFGLKWLLWHEEMKRNLKRFQRAREEVEVGKISGAVGNFANIPPFVEEYVCEKLSLRPAPVSTQILQRDRFAYYMATIAVIGGTLEKMALEIRHLQRTEVHEVEENFTKGQKGSSAMPHKRNPISSENICGCARILRGYTIPALENQALWHERDISHSSTERILFPDATMLLDYMVNRLKNILEHLVVYEDQMKKNIYHTQGIIFAQRVMNALIEKDFSRERAYDLVQPIAMESYRRQISFQQLLYENEEITKTLTKEEIDSCFTLEYYFKNVDYIYQRCDVSEKSK